MFFLYQIHHLSRRAGRCMYVLENGKIPSWITQNHLVFWLTYDKLDSPGLDFVPRLNSFVSCLVYNNWSDYLSLSKIHDKLYIGRGRGRIICFMVEIWTKCYVNLNAQDHTVSCKWKNVTPALVWMEPPVWTPSHLTITVHVCLVTLVSVVR